MRETTSLCAVDQCQRANSFRLCTDVLKEHVCWEVSSGRSQCRRWRRQSEAAACWLVRASCGLLCWWGRWRSHVQVIAVGEQHLASTSSSEGPGASISSTSINQLTVDLPPPVISLLLSPLQPSHFYLSKYICHERFLPPSSTFIDCSLTLTWNPVGSRTREHVQLSGCVWVCYSMFVLVSLRFWSQT